MSERSRSPEGPRHLAPGSELLPWWQLLDPKRLWIALGITLLAVPLLVLDQLPDGPDSAQAVETVAPTSPSTAAAPTTSTTIAAATTLAPTTTPPETAAPATAAPTVPPTTRPAPTSTRPAPPPTTAPPTTAPPAPAGSVEEIIHSYFGAAGETAVAVARCESSLNPSAQSPSGYYGLFQIGSSHASAFQQVTGRSFASAWADPVANTQYARYLYDRGGGSWASWGACNPD